MQDEDFTEDTGRPSKTKQKEVMHELRDLGAELVELSVGQLKRINVPEINARTCSSSSLLRSF